MYAFDHHTHPQITMKGTPQAQIETLLSQLLDAGWNPNDIRCTFESALNRCSACEELGRERGKGTLDVLEDQQREHQTFKVRDISMPALYTTRH